MKFYSLILILVFKVNLCLSQTDTVVSKVFTFSGSIGANTNGFSLVPTFSLGKPAMQTGFNFSASHSRLSFHPQIWYSLLDYKPWSFIFIWRYKMIDKEKFSFVVGTHAPAINFKSATVIDNGLQNDIVKARRFYPALELFPTYKLSKNTSVGIYYLLGIGIEKEVATTNNFVSLRVDFNKINLSKKIFMRFNPQVYFLSIDKHTGIYAAGSLAIGHHGIPITLSTAYNKSLKSTINSKDFDWNVGINYEFKNLFVKH